MKIPIRNQDQGKVRRGLEVLGHRAVIIAPDSTGTKSQRPVPVLSPRPPPKASSRSTEPKQEPSREYSPPPGNPIRGGRGGRHRRTPRPPRAAIRLAQGPPGCPGLAAPVRPLRHQAPGERGATSPV